MDTWSESVQVSSPPSHTSRRPLDMAGSGVRRSCGLCRGREGSSVTSPSHTCLHTCVWTLAIPVIFFEREASQRQFFFFFFSVCVCVDIVTKMDISRGYLAGFFTREGERRLASPASFGERAEASCQLVFRLRRAVLRLRLYCVLCLWQCVNCVTLPVFCLVNERKCQQVFLVTTQPPMFWGNNR